jgi:hypothetical protein
VRSRRLVRVSVLVLAAIAAVSAQRGARALPPAGTDLLPLAAVVEASSALGEERVAATGWLALERAAPRLEGGVEVVDLVPTKLSLRGASRLGVVTVALAGDGSRGELRATGPVRDFPASSRLDLFVEAALPESPFGPTTVRNEVSLRLAPDGDGLVDGWPPLGERFVLDLDGAPCLPLRPAPDAAFDLELCVRSLELSVAPQLVSYVVGRGGPSGHHPADVFSLVPSAVSSSVQSPFLRLPCASLGLSADGCDGGADGDQDALDALSFGAELAPGAAFGIDFSTGPGARGRRASAVEEQSRCPPADPGVSPEPESDVFASAQDGTNVQLFDGNGPVGACASTFPLGLVESIGGRDDLNAFDAHDGVFVDPDADGVPDLAVYFSLDAASPSLAAFGVSPADVLRASGGAAPEVFASAAALGLRADDDLDALCLRESGDGVFDAFDVLYFSLAAGSPTLAAIGARPGDVLAPPAAGGPPLSVAASGGALGLAPGDELDALACRGLRLAPVIPGGNVNCDGRIDSVDAALILQLEAGLIVRLGCFDEGDVDGDRTITSADAAIVLRRHAGLLPHPPDI